MPQENQGRQRPPHLLACISGHGYGHLAQTAPVLNALRRRLPDLLLSVRSALPLPLLRARIDGPFQYLRDGSDTGMAMSSALEVKVQESAEAYQRLHRDWGLTVMREAQTLREFGADFVLANIGYLPLAGARRAGIPCAAMSSLNWADICVSSWTTLPAPVVPVSAPFWRSSSARREKRSEVRWMSGSRLWAARAF